MNRNGFLVWGLLIALAVRIAYLFLTVNAVQVPQPHTGDDYHYYAMGMEVKEQGFTFKDTSSYPKGEELNFTAPFMAWYLGLIFKVFGVNWYAVIAFNLLFSLLLVYLIYKITLLLTEENRYANLALLISAFYFPFFYFLDSAGKEVLTAAFFMLTVYLVLLIEQSEKSFLTAILAAFAYSLMCHLDERYIFYLPLLILFIYLIAAQTEDKTLKVIGYTAVFIVALAISFLPWLQRNYEVYKKPVLLSARMMPFTDKLLGISSQKLAMSENLSNRSEAYQYLSPEQLDSIVVKHATVHRQTPVTAKEYEFIRNVRKPYRYNKWQQYLSHAKDLWRITNFRGDYIGTGYRFDRWSPKRNLMSLLTYGIVLLTAILGCGDFVRRQGTVFAFFVSIFILHTLIHVFVIGSGLTRYRYPLDGLLIVLAASALGYAFLGKIEKRRR